MAAWGYVTASQQGILEVSDVETTGTWGGTLTASTWTTRVVNTLTGSSSTNVTLPGSNVITFAAGTYNIYATVPCVNGLANMAQWFNTGNSTVILNGTSAYAATGGSSSLSIISGTATFGSTTTTIIRHWVGQTQANYGGGQPTGISGVTEMYTNIWIQQLV